MARAPAAASGSRWQRPELAFAVLASLFGVAFTVTTPPLQTPDENRHFVRAWLVASGQPAAVPFPGAPHHGVAAAEVPTSIAQMTARLGPAIAFHPGVRQDLGRLAAEWRVALAPEQREWQVLPTSYSPLVYLPQAAGVALGRLLGLPPVAYVYLGRLANLAAFVALGFAALLLAPVHRWTLFLVALAPMSVFLAGSLSADVLGNGIALLFVAAVLAAARRSGPIAARELAGLLVLAALLGLAKPPVALLAPLALLVPAARFGGRGRWLAASAAALAAAAATTALWQLALSSLELPNLVQGSDQGVQLRRILADPLGFVALLGGSLRASAGDYARSTVGVLGWLDTPLPAAVYPAWWAVLLGVAVADGGPASPVRGWRRALCLGLVLVAMVAVFFLIYLFNPVGARPIAGVQGRYFLPFLPLALMALQRPAGGLPGRAAATALPLFAAALLAVALVTTGLRYYGAP